MFWRKILENREITNVFMRFCMVSGFGGGRWIRTTEGIASRFTVCKEASYFAVFSVFDNMVDNFLENLVTFFASCFFRSSV